MEAANLTPAQEKEYEAHLRLLQNLNLDDRSVQEEEARAAPLFAGAVMTRVPQYYSQYGLLGQILPMTPVKGAEKKDDATPAAFADSRIMLNVGAPWSAFICGQQGSGKSHSLSCILENCLVSSSAGTLPKPLSGMIFHWDRFTGYSSHQICEAAYLASSGIPVRVLVSPSNYHVMKDAYENLPGFSNVANKPKVLPLLFRDEQLNVKRMLTMMGVKTDAEALPLYLEVGSMSYHLHTSYTNRIQVILRILRELALDSGGAAGFDYAEFRRRLAMEDFTGARKLIPYFITLDFGPSFRSAPQDE